MLIMKSALKLKSHFFNNSIRTISTSKWKVSDVSYTHQISKQLTRRQSKENLVLTGSRLTISDIHAFIHGKVEEVSMSKEAKNVVKDSHNFLTNHINKGSCIYGVNTGFGGSADVRCGDTEAVNRGLLVCLNSGFGKTLPSWLVKGVMLVRANSLSNGYSAVNPEILQRLIDLINHDIIPEVPMFGSISSSGDLIPTSYIAACLEARPDLKVTYCGQSMMAPEAFKNAGLQPVHLAGKDGLAIVNAISFASALSSEVLYRSGPAIMLTQLMIALGVEALQGRLESFHPFLHDTCLPHPGQKEVARNIRRLLLGTKLALTQYEVDRGCHEGELKQDRYALRTSPQWLGPVIETVSRLQETVTIELNSANDNPVMDAKSNLVLHGGNFQGTAITVAMDQLRQSLQLCGKLLFALMSEVIDVTSNNGLTPNLCGSDSRSNMGFKAAEIAMASFMSELDYITNPLTNHVLVAEVRNQSVNSLALISARQTEKALELLQMQIANITHALIQAVELRWIKSKVLGELKDIFSQCNINNHELIFLTLPWYQFLYAPCETVEKLTDELPTICAGQNFDPDLINKSIIPRMQQIYSSLHAGEYTEKVKASLGKGTREMYSFIRKHLGIQFQDGSAPMDTPLEAIYESITSDNMDELILLLCGMCDEAPLVEEYQTLPVHHLPAYLGALHNTPPDGSVECHQAKTHV